MVDGVGWGVPDFSPKIIIKNGSNATRLMKGVCKKINITNRCIIITIIHAPRHQHLWCLHSHQHIKTKICLNLLLICRLCVISFAKGHIHFGLRHNHMDDMYIKKGREHLCWITMGTTGPCSPLKCSEVISEAVVDQTVASSLWSAFLICVVHPYTGCGWRSTLYTHTHTHTQRKPTRVLHALTIEHVEAHMESHLDFLPA